MVRCARIQVLEDAVYLTNGRYFALYTAPRTMEAHRDARQIARTPDATAQRDLVGALDDRAHTRAVTLAANAQ